MNPGMAATMFSRPLKTGRRSNQLVNCNQHSAFCHAVGQMADGYVFRLSWTAARGNVNMDVGLQLRPLNLLSES